MADSHPADDDLEVDLGDRSIYSYWNHHVIRFADLDPANHVNNVAYAQYFESGRVAFWCDAERDLAVSGAMWVIARLVIDYCGFSSDKTIEQRGLADVRPSYDSHQWFS